MAIEIRETFTVSAPVEEVWQFILDPRNVVTCMPGAELDEAVDERTFLGSLQLQLGAIRTRYKGRIELTSVNEDAHSVELKAEGRETGGGTARGTVSARLEPRPDGQIDVVTEARIDLTGRIVQVGGRMIQGVARELFRQFAGRVQQHFQSPPVQRSPEGKPADTRPLRVVPLVLRALWASLVGMFRRLRRSD